MTEEHIHEHDESCDCGCEHDHGHAHAHDCEQGHDHDCDHDHDCGHDHGHEGCGHSHEGGCSHGQVGVPTVKTVDKAVVGSMRFEIPAIDPTATEMLVTAELKRIQSAIEKQGGIVGHAKASFETKKITKISVVDNQTTVDHADAKTATGEIAIIAFFIPESIMAWLLNASSLK